MESLEERLRSLEALIKSPVTKLPENKLAHDADILTPSSLSSALISTSSLREQAPYASDTFPKDAALRKTNEPSIGETLQQALNASPLTGTAPMLRSHNSFQQIGTGPLALKQSDPHSGMSARALATTEVEPIPQISADRPGRCSLPPVQGGLFLLQEYLVDFNTVHPIFDPVTITALFHKFYNGFATGLPVEWVALRVVLGTAHRLRAMSPLGVPQDTENAAIYLQESLDKVQELLLLRPSLLQAQCFLGLGTIIQTSPRPYPAQLFTTLALRVVQDLHVNDPNQPESVDTGDLLQQQRVFWLAYFMDADMCLRAGRLPSLSPRLINVALPGDSQPNSVGEIVAMDGQFKANILRLHAELALLQADFMEQVLLPRAHRSSVYSEDVELRSITARLEEWRRNWLFELDAESLRTALHRSDTVHVVVLESKYFSTAFAFRAHIAPVSKTRHSPFSAEGLIEGVSKQKAQMLYKDARRFIDLLRVIPGDDIACNW